MAEEYILINDIIENHSQRMDNIKKYYPFFKLQETTFLQYKEGRYMDLDMGYITLATLRFFIEENSFRERPVRYERYQKFLKELLRRDFQLQESEEELEELILYLFDKIKNEGKPFYFPYFDPKDKKRKTSRIKLIESQIENGTIFYYITADGIEFYLDTKEIKEESEISVQQLLLEKMIHANNFRGGIEVVKRMNAQVSKMSLKKREVIAILEADVHEGVNAFNRYMNQVAKWFQEEEKLFSKNKELIEKALNKVELELSKEDTRQNHFKMLEEIYELETELKKTIERHAQLISETMELSKVTDTMIAKAKLKRLRPLFDFQKQLQVLEEQDNPEKLGRILKPLFKPNVKKTFSFENLDHLLTNRGEPLAKAEKVTEETQEDAYAYPDELEEQRIHQNFYLFSIVLLEQIKRKHKITLKELNAVLEIRFGSDLFRNQDYYSFLVHLCQKKTYQVQQMLQNQDTFLEGIVANEWSREEKERYEKIAFTLSMCEEEITVGPDCTVSNIVFERTDK